ncbi:hypothetical protein WOLCODRAFT_123878 [Wolfiporia cocos MD-104 SS10]|uniref:Uncharacterized protein n=1 Tax=Wolfiporia cocos (strain MD-104) TaxID=742152 RepID=A0A2H3JR61_WOLCO|nr:hypothetical protein WOLCODRAFT_123878 [Wolfiporia cocos MD-104 SS10]
MSGSNKLENAALQNAPNESSSEYKPFFGLDSAKRADVPRWVPVSLLALTTAAMVVPAILLRRQRAALLDKSLSHTPPPPPRRSSGTLPPLSPSSGISSSSNNAPPPRRVPVVASRNPVPSPARAAIRAHPAAVAETEASKAADDSNFNGALLSAGAFGIATAIVSVGAGLTLWGVKTSLGVSNAQEFADRVRALIIERMPLLSSRIHRRIQREDETSELRLGPPTTPSSHIHVEPASGAAEWTWHDAEKRLKAAFQQDGIVGWAEAALQELEAEGELERAKRGHT